MAKSEPYEIPTMDQIRELAEKKGYVCDLDDFFNYNTRMGWRTQDGSRIRDWRKMLDVWNRNAKIRAKPQVRPEYSEDPDEISPEERAALIADIELAQEAIRNCSTMEAARDYYYERTVYGKDRT